MAIVPLVPTDGSLKVEAPARVVPRPDAPVKVEVPAQGASELPDASRVRAIVELGKPGITKLVTITAAVAFGLAAAGRVWTAGQWGALALTFAACVVGTALSSGGANAINQWMERHRDALMNRTRKRPLPQQRLSAGSALLAGIAMSLAGLGVLGWLCGPAAALVSLATIVVYVGLYTPSKVLTPLNTILGAVPGALPPLIGWSAAQFPVLGWAHAFDSLAEPAGWSLFGLMFVWQIPHFLALAWMYRDDYAAGGYLMLPVVDFDGALTARTMLGWAVMLIPATVLPVLVMPGRIGWPYGLVAVVSGAAFLWMVAGFVRVRSHGTARRVFLGSIMHLPLLMVAMVLEAAIRWVVKLGA